MSLLLRALAIAVVGLALGAGTIFALQGPGQALDGAPNETPVTESRSGGELHGAGTAAPMPLPAPSQPVGGLKPAPVPTPEGRVMLGWTPGGLPEGFTEALASLPPVEHVTVVDGGLLEMTASRDVEGMTVDAPAGGFVIPLDAIAIDPATYASFVPKSALPVLGALDDGEVLLGERSAVLRGLGAGAEIDLAGGRRITVGGIVEDELIGGAELALHARDADGTAAAVPRYALVTYTGERAIVEEAVRAALPAATPLRLRGPGETPFLRHGDAVLPQAVIKERFGEFSYRPGNDRDFVQDPAWAAEHIVTAELPILGEVRCHRALVPALEGAMAELEAANIAHLVDPEGYAGCHSPRLVSAETSVSRHAWGVAVDLNFPANPVGLAGTQDDRLVEVMERWGFTWGGEWLIPDPAHFEYIRPPPLE